MNNELLYQIALDFVKGIGSSLAKQLVAYTGSPEAIFKEEGKALLKIPGINDEKVRAITNPQVLRWAEEEIAFIERHHLKTYFFTEEEYPFKKRMCGCAYHSLWQGVIERQRGEICQYCRHAHAY